MLILFKNMQHLRLSLDNLQDREFLQKTKDKQTGKSLFELARAAEDKSNNLIHSNTHLKNKNESESLTEKKKTVSSRYGNKIFKDQDGITWHSVYEKHCWLILKDFEKKGYLFNLERQVEYPFVVNQIKIFKYVADFTFDLKRSEDNLEYYQKFVLDAKSPVTRKFQRYNWQKKAMKAFYNLQLVELVKGETNVIKVVYNLKNSL